MAPTGIDIASVARMPDARTDKLDEAFRKLEDETPGCLGRGILWMRAPRMRLLRLPLGILLILGSFLWFLPVLGLWFLRVGLLLIAQDCAFRPRRTLIPMMADTTGA